MINLFTMAKKGSVRIPGKNMKLFLNQPLIEYTFKTMQNLPYHKSVVTDWEEIKDLAVKMNIQVKDENNYIDLPCNQKLRILYPGYKKDDIFVLLPPTSPAREADKIEQWINEFEASGKDCGYTVKQIKQSHYYIDGQPVNFSTEKRTEIRSVFTETGSMYIFRGKMLDQEFFLNQNYILLEDHFFIDLDNLEEWERGENEYKNYIGDVL